MTAAPNAQLCAPDSPEHCSTTPTPQLALLTYIGSLYRPRLGRRAPTGRLTGGMPGRSERCPPPGVAGVQGAQPDLELVVCGRVDVGVAQQRGDGGQLADVAQYRIAGPAPDVVAVGGDERVALMFWEAEPGRLQGGDQVDFAGTGADRVPVSQHHPVAVAEQVPLPGVAVDHPWRQAEIELAVGMQQSLAVVVQPGALVVADRLAGLDRRANGAERLIGRRREWGRPEAVQAAQQVAQVRRAGLRAVLRQVAPEGH